MIKHCPHWCTIQTNESPSNLNRTTWKCRRPKGSKIIPLMWLAPNIFGTDVSLMTGTFPNVSTVSLAPFVIWALSHWHLFLIQHCPRGTFPHVTCTHACNHAIFSHFSSTKFGWTPLDQLGTNGFYTMLNADQQWLPMVMSGWIISQQWCVTLTSWSLSSVVIC